MEDVSTFKTWLYQLLSDAQKKLEIKNSTLADILLKEGLNYYLKDVATNHQAHQNKNLRP